MTHARRHPLWKRLGLWRRLTALLFFGLLTFAAAPIVLSGMDLGADGAPGAAGTFAPGTPARGLPARWFRGMTAATTTFDTLPLVDPLAATEVALATGRVTTTTAIGAGLLLGAALVLGPVFCAWACPLGFLLDLNERVRAAVLRRGSPHRRPLTPAEPRRAWRAAVLAGCATFALAAGVPMFQALSPIHGVARAVLLGSAGAGIVVASIAALEWWRPRLWCRVLCPVGALYGAVGRGAPLAVRIDRSPPAHCGGSGCRACAIRCPMGIRVLEQHVQSGAARIVDSACTRCGACVDGCPGGVLRLGVRRARKAGPGTDRSGEAAPGMVGLTMSGMTTGGMTTSGH